MPASTIKSLLSNLPIKKVTQTVMAKIKKTIFEAEDKMFIVKLFILIIIVVHIIIAAIAVWAHSPTVPKNKTKERVKERYHND